MGVAKKYISPPRSAMEVFMMLPEGTLAELINDTIYMAPAPGYEHQKVILDLAFQMHGYIEKNKIGTCVLAPIDVFFDNKNVLQPDILFISKQNMGIIKSGKIKGTPDIIIEILSPGNKKPDTEKKKVVYEKFGVKEYFTADPETKETITWYLTRNKFVKQVSAKGKLKSKLLRKTFSF